MTFFQFLSRMKDNKRRKKKKRKRTTTLLLLGQVDNSIYFHGSWLTTFSSFSHYILTSSFLFFKGSSFSFFLTSARACQCTRNYKRKKKKGLSPFRVRKDRPPKVAILSYHPPTDYSSSVPFSRSRTKAVDPEKRPPHEDLFFVLCLVRNCSSFSWAGRAKWPRRFYSIHLTHRPDNPDIENQ